MNDELHGYSDAFILSQVAYYRKLGGHHGHSTTRIHGSLLMYVQEARRRNLREAP